MNEETYFLIKLCISHTLFSRGLMFLLCVRGVWRQGQTAILTQLLLLTIAVLLPHLGWGCSTGGRWGPQPSVCKLALTLAFLSPTNSTATGTCLYSFIMLTCIRFFFRLFTQVHLWLTARSRVNIQHKKRNHMKQHLYAHLPPIFKTVYKRWTRHAGHCWRSKDQFISDVLQWNPLYGRASVGRPTRTYQN